MYPELDPALIGRLKLVQQMVEADPKYLDKPDCPYPQAVKDYFKNKKSAVKKGANVEPIDLAVEAAELYLELKEYGEALNQENTKDYMVWLKTVVQVQARLLELEQDAMNVKRQRAFEAAIFSAMEELPAEHRTKVIDTLNAVLAAN